MIHRGMGYYPAFGLRSATVQAFARKIYDIEPVAMVMAG
jgi:hypothetical protein